MQILHIMIGAPASGKSTFIKNHMKSTDKYVSRDEIRFSMLQEGEEYFSHETEVFKTFAKTIKEYLKEGYNVWADATHLNLKSRIKLLTAIGLYYNHDNIKIIGHIMKTSLDNCITNNSNRIETKSYVPVSAIKKMYSQLETPDCEIEPFDEIRIEVSK